MTMTNGHNCVSILIAFLGGILLATLVLQQLQVPSHVIVKRECTATLPLIPLTPSPTSSKLSDSKQPIYVAIGLLSRGSASDLRDQVRRIWAKESQRHVTIDGVTYEAVVRFFLSSDEINDASVAREMSERKDIEVVEGEVVYRTLLKKSWAVFEWCRRLNASYCFKGDDDIWLSIGALVRLLRAYDGEESLYLGRMFKGAAVHTGDASPWRNVAFAQKIGGEVYPTFASGGGYVLSACVVRWLIAIDELRDGGGLLERWPNEDTTIGTWLLPLNVSARVDIGTRSLWWDGTPAPRAFVCAHLDVIIFHRMGSIIEFARTLHDCRKSAGFASASSVGRASGEAKTRKRARSVNLRKFRARPKRQA
jgi:Galactosyltransferase